MPLYKAKHEMRVGKYEVDDGMDFNYLGWPEDGMEPANEPAREVAKYFEANRENPRLLSAPWCLLRQAVVLPELPEVLKHPGQSGWGGE